MVRIGFAVCLLLGWLMVVNCGHLQLAPGKTPAHAPALPPSKKDCSSIIYDMSDCISFISDGSKEIKPTSACCSGFESVLKVDFNCICEAMKNSAELGIKLNVTKAATLPSACGVNAPPISTCGVSLSPGAAPAKPPAPPMLAPSPKSQVPAIPGPIAEATSAPAQAPHAGSYSIEASLFVLISMLAISFSYMSM